MTAHRGKDTVREAGSGLSRRKRSCDGSQQGPSPPFLKVGQTLGSAGGVWENPGGNLIFVQGLEHFGPGSSKATGTVLSFAAHRDELWYLNKEEFWLPLFWETVLEIPSMHPHLFCSLGRFMENISRTHGTANSAQQHFQITLFQQPWTGRPSSPCEKDGWKRSLGHRK